MHKLTEWLNYWSRNFLFTLKRWINLVDVTHPQCSCFQAILVCVVVAPTALASLLSSSVSLVPSPVSQVFQCPGSPSTDDSTRKKLAYIPVFPLAA